MSARNVEPEAPDFDKRRTSPAAKAFFAALDLQSGNNSSRQSRAIQKKIQTLGWRNRYSQDDWYPIQLCNDTSTFSVKQVQRGEVEGTYGTGATVWPAAVVLIKYLERHADTILMRKTSNNCRLVDLGAGTGVTSLAAAFLGATHVCCTDGEDSVVELAKSNIRHNCSVETDQSNDTFRVASCTVNVQQYWWGSGSLSNQPPFDVILVADCVLPKLYPLGPLVDAIDELLVLPDAVAILSYEYRYFAEYDPKQKFTELCTTKGLKVITIPLSEHDSVYSVEDIEIWHVKRA